MASRPSTEARATTDLRSLRVGDWSYEPLPSALLPHGGPGRAGEQSASNQLIRQARIEDCVLLSSFVQHSRYQAPRSPATSIAR